MEYQGIITGVGNKDTSTNLITPQVDAAIYNYIIGKNAIIDGLAIAGNNLTKGECVLLGYRGILKNNIYNIGTNTYIYGKFSIYFNESTENPQYDEFVIETSNSLYPTPTAITSAGTYRLLLYTYTNGAYVVNPNLDNTHKYPLNAYEADETNLLLPNGEISSTATTETAENNAHLTEPLRVANTEYVHNQIEEEIAYDTQNIDIIATYSDNTEVVGHCVLKRKAKYIIGSLSISTTIPYRHSLRTPILTVPQGFIPEQAFTCWIAYTNMQGRQNQDPAEYYHKAKVQFATNGNVTFISDEASFTSGFVIDNTCVIGYETN